MQYGPTGSGSRSETVAGIRQISVTADGASARKILNEIAAKSGISVEITDYPRKSSSLPQRRKVRKEIRRLFNIL